MTVDSCIEGRRKKEEGRKKKEEVRIDERAWDMGQYSIFNPQSKIQNLKSKIDMSILQQLAKRKQKF
ncbi:MAG: hypothetical protein MUE44_08010 [Oscillatoriaceae cyanobacterium Prado104]|nr:hypothetical protein [Oscillatoriaceae cyanobacterium Prado104]